MIVPTRGRGVTGVLDVVTGQAIRLGGVTIQRSALFTMIALAVCAAGLWWFIGHTRTGRGMHALKRLVAAVPPLHRIEVVNRGRANDYVYTYSEAQLHRELARLRKNGRTLKDPLQRYKGLGEMDADQLAETTMDPAHRTLRRVTMADVEAGERIFTLLMGNEVAPRKEFIVSNAAQLDAERIDA